MDRSYPYSRRLFSRDRQRKRLAAVAAAALLVAAGVFMLTWEADPISAAIPTPSMPARAVGGIAGSEPAGQAVRRIYPYSVVPGGVTGASELQRIIRTDRVVAAHYASFDAARARNIVVAKPRAVHVSYRKGDQVYWTAHKVMLAPGETLLSDGRNEMRARCANRISELPQYPVEAHRPAMAELDQAVELAEGEEYALGPDGMPVAASADGGIPRHTAMRFPARGASAAGNTASSPAASTLAANTAFNAGAIAPLTTLGLSGASSSLGSRPRPSGGQTSAATAEADQPAAPDGQPDAGSGSSGGASSAPAPSAGGSTPPAPATAEPVTSQAPDSTRPGTPAADPGGQAPLPVPLPDTEPVSVPGTPAQRAVPGPTVPPTQPAPVPAPALLPAPEAVPPRPMPEPLPPQTIEQPAPAEVPEPASPWLFGLALAAMGVLRRRGLR